MSTVRSGAASLGRVLTLTGSSVGAIVSADLIGLVITVR
jgi:hypothetical protein